MLLLFWKQEDLKSGYARATRWYHPNNSAPRLLVATTSGFDVYCPYFENCCSCFGYRGIESTAIDIYDDKLIIGTIGSGIYCVPWGDLESLGLCNSLSYEGSYYSFGQLAGNNVSHLATQSNYLGVITNSGFEYWSNTVSGFILYPTTNGKSAFITSDESSFNSKIYFAEGSNLKVSNNPWNHTCSGWSYTYSGLGIGTLKGVWVEETAYNNIFVVGTGGTVYIQERDMNKSTNIYDFTSVISGSTNLISVTAEADAQLNNGHYFTLSADGVNIINLQIYNSIDSNNIEFQPISDLVDIEFTRPYKK